MTRTASSIAGRAPRSTSEQLAPASVATSPLDDDSHPFDDLAAAYDAGFVAGAVGGRMRRALWRRIDARFAAGDRVLDLGCGTGEDAVHLAARGVAVTAIDASAAMVAAARDKAARAGFAEWIAVRQLAIEDLDRLGGDRFDGALSSFGALNCVADLPAVARTLAALLKPGAPALVCLMGPTVPWEWAWFLARGRPATAFRRLRPGGVAWRGLTVRYPSIGALVPPTFAERWAAAHPRLLDRLDRWERRWETAPPLPRLADHYLAELERR